MEAFSDIPEEAGRAEECLVCASIDDIESAPRKPVAARNMAAEDNTAAGPVEPAQEAHQAL